MKTRTKIAAALLALASAQAGAKEYPHEHLFEVVGSYGITRDQFAAELAPRLREYSDETGHEACGVIATDGERFGIRVGTSGSHIGCVNIHSNVPDGMTDTGYTIHSHGTDRPFNVNRADKLFIPESHHGRRRIEGQVLDRFSPQDLLAPGYLATPNGVIFQSGGVVSN